MRRPALLPLLLLAVLSPGAAAQDDTRVHLTKEQALATVFAGAEQVLELRHLLSRDELHAVEELLGESLDEGGFYLYTARAGGTVVGHAVVVSQIGKVKPITHIVGVTPSGEVGTVAVMIYRESHGDEVADPRFMAQYRGKRLDDTIRIDRDIINIAGATLSGHAICRGVRKALAVTTVVLLRKDEAARAALLATAEDVTPPGLQPRGAVGHDPPPTAHELAAGPGTPGGAPPAERGDAGPLRLERETMGTVCTITAYGEPGQSSAALEAAVSAALDEVARWDGVLSDWRDDTPLSQLNRAAAGERVTLDPDLLAWLLDARALHEATGGAFDPAVGGLVDAWGLRTRAPARPSPAELARALAGSGLRHVEVDAEAGLAVRRHADVRLDPGASGKGFALDRAAAVLRRHGVRRALLSFRSTLLALEPPPGQDGWPSPVVHDGTGEQVALLVLASEALSVSGGALRAFADGDVERGHVLDPATGVPVPAASLAWVRHVSAAGADALSTALLVRGPTLPAVGGAAGGHLASPGATPASWPLRP